MIRVSREVYDELVRIRQEFFEEHRVMISMSEAIAQLLADRKPVQP